MTIPTTRYNGCIVPLTLRRHRPKGGEQDGVEGGEQQPGEQQPGEKQPGVEGGEQDQPGAELDVVWLNPHCAGATFLRPFLMSFEPETTPMVSLLWLSWFLWFLWLSWLSWFYGYHGYLGFYGNHVYA